MSPSEDNASRLRELRLLWESDRTSKVYLQLAEELRKAGQLDEAIDVLEKSLEHRPRDPRGRVSLARCRLDQGRASLAAELLEEVTRQDPAHVVACKLLLETYLQLGEAAKAEKSLEIYRLLNERDPELDHLEFRLERLKSAPSSAPAVQSADPTPTEQVAALVEEVGSTDPAPPPADLPMANLPMVDLAAADSTPPADPMPATDPMHGIDAAPASEPLSATDAAVPEVAMPEQGEVMVPETDDQSALEAQPAFEMEPVPESEPSASELSASELSASEPSASELSASEPSTEPSASDIGTTATTPITETATAEPAFELEPEPATETTQASPTVEEMVSVPEASPLEVAAPEAVPAAAGAPGPATDDLFDLGAPPPAPSLDDLFGLGSAPAAPAPSLDDLWGGGAESIAVEPAEEPVAEPEVAVVAESVDVPAVDVPSVDVPSVEEAVGIESVADDSEAPTLSPSEMPTTPATTLPWSKPADTPEVELPAAEAEEPGAPETVVADVDAVVAEADSVTAIEDAAHAEPAVGAEAGASEEAGAPELYATVHNVSPEALAAAELALQQDAAPAEPPPEADLAVPAPADQPATATLGHLYLRQGHFSEAERIFAEVLEREPDNEAALEGARRVQEEQRAAATEPAIDEMPAAAETLAEEAAAGDIAVASEPEVSEVLGTEPPAAEESQPEAPPVEGAPEAGSGGEATAAEILADRSLGGIVPEGLTAKKILILEQYRKRLRRAAERHVH